jgi:SAM-dependent methyltransferase
VSRGEEAARLRKVYREYDSDLATRDRWGDNIGNRLMLAERDNAVATILRASGLLPWPGGRVLEIGCGSGRNLALLQRLGIPTSALTGVDLIPERIEQARSRLPDVALECADATDLPYESGTFRLILLFTVTSSILDRGVASRLAAEVRRLLMNGGGVLWYDMRVGNPRNPNVRGVNRNEIEALFPDYSIATLRSITLLPPMARQVGRFVPWLYRPLAALPILRSHLIGLFIRPSMGTA